jgi:tetratricopeptide (TPR) repeat protein
VADSWPTRFWEELSRRKVIRVAVVYTVVAWAAVEAASVIFPALLLPEWTERLVVALALLGFPVALALAWAFEVRLDGGPAESQAAAPEPVGEERLDGWKRIAAYLNRDVRTVRRWEKDRGLPVRRLMHDKLATVYAYRSELDAWMTRRDTAAPEKPAARRKMRGKPGPRWAWVAVPALIVGMALAWLWPRQEAAPIRFGEWDWVVVTQFENRTGEEMIDGVVEYALKRELANSHYVKVAPPERINDALRLMRLPPDSVIDLEIGREISLRDGGIKMLIAGQVARLGNTYQVSAELVSPADGVSLTSFNFDASSQDEILPGVATLAQKVRESLGESLASIASTSEMLAKVTTPSFEALKLYSEADRLMRGADRIKAIPVLEQALRVDPDFASAHLLLFYVLRDRGEIDRASEHLQRAVTLAEQATERERLFILATYYGYLDDLDRQIETYDLLLRLYPDHTWASGNLGHLLAWLGRYDQAGQLRTRNAELAPNDFTSQYWAALFAEINSDREASRHYLDRARALAADNRWMNARVDFFPVHAAWIRGEWQEALDRTEEIIESRGAQALVADGAAYGQARSILMTLGRFDRFSELSSLRPQLGWLKAVTDLDSGRPEGYQRYLDGELRGFWDAALAALGGRIELARQLIEDPRAVESLPPPFVEKDWRNFALGHLALAEGRAEQAIELLQQDDLILFVTAGHAHQLAMNSLAHAFLKAGRPEEAIATLEAVRKRRYLTITEPGATWFWMRNMVLLYEMYRDVGNEARMEAVATELEGPLSLAEDDHPFLVKVASESSGSE